MKEPLFWNSKRWGGKGWCLQVPGWHRQKLRGMAVQRMHAGSMQEQCIGYRYRNHLALLRTGVAVGREVVVEQAQSVGGAKGVRCGATKSAPWCRWCSKTADLCRTDLHSSISLVPNLGSLCDDQT